MNINLLKLMETDVMKQILLILIVDESTDIFVPEAFAPDDNHISVGKQLFLNNFVLFL